MSELEELAKRWNKAWFEKDAAFVDSMLMPNYVYVAPNGQVLDRDAILGVIRSPTYKLERGTDSEYRVVELAPDAAIVIHHWQGRGTLNGRVFNDNHRAIIVFVKRGRKWMIALEQASPVA